MVTSSTVLFIAFIAVVVATALALAIPAIKPPKEEEHDNIVELLNRIEWRLDMVTEQILSLKESLKKK